MTGKSIATLVKRANVEWGTSRPIQPSVYASSADGNREGFDPILNSAGPGPRHCWGHGELTPSEIHSLPNCRGVDRASFLIRLADDGSSTITFTFRFTAPLDAAQVFFALDLARKVRSVQSAQPNATQLHRAGTKSLFEHFCMLFTDILLPLAQAGHLTILRRAQDPANALSASYQCPYIVTELTLPDGRYPWHSPTELTLPSRPLVADAEAGDTMCWRWHSLNPTSDQRKIAALLLRPVIWQSYLPDFEHFRVPSEVFREARFPDQDYFWDNRGLVIFHPRSTVFFSAMPTPQTSDLDAVELTWRSLMDVLESLRGRWHLYIGLNAGLDEVASRIARSETGNAQDILTDIMERRQIFIRSLGYSLPYSHTASHLIELARAAERGFGLDELFNFTMRKFEAVNWLFGDLVESERRAFLAGIEDHRRSSETE